jgi:hypothetical protein
VPIVCQNKSISNRKNCNTSLQSLNQQFCAVSFPSVSLCPSRPVSVQSHCSPSHAFHFLLQSVSFKQTIFFPFPPPFHHPSIISTSDTEPCGPPKARCMPTGVTRRQHIISLHSSCFTMRPKDTPWLGECPSSLIVYIPSLPLPPLIPFPSQDRQFISVLYSAALLLLQLLYFFNYRKAFSTVFFALCLRLSLSLSLSLSWVVISHIL